MSKFDWMDDALCKEVGPDLFLSDNTYDSKVAKKVCHRCVVVSACLSWAIENPEIQGVLGGTTQKERYKIRQRQNENRRTA